MLRLETVADTVCSFSYKFSDFSPFPQHTHTHFRQAEEVHQRDQAVLSAIEALVPGGGSAELHRTKTVRGVGRV